MILATERNTEMITDKDNINIRAHHHQCYHHSRTSKFLVPGGDLKCFMSIHLNVIVSAIWAMICTRKTEPAVIWMELISKFKNTCGIL
jgi:hypothetical protein